MDAITKFKPTGSLTQALEINEELPDNEAAFDLLKKLVLAKSIQDVAFLTIGKILKLIRDRKLYTYFDYENFSEFLASEDVSFSREKAYVYIRVYELFVEKLQFNPEDIGKLGVVRLMLLVPVIKDIDNKKEAIEKIGELKDLRYNDFVRTIKQHTNKDGKPELYWSDEAGKWIVRYFENITNLIPLGDYEKPETE